MKILVVCIFINVIIGQDNIVGKNDTIKSFFLNQDKKIQVFLPESYHKSEKKYPVLYVLDGERYFLHAVSLLQTYTRFKNAPEFIVLGIRNDYRGRGRHFIADAKKYMNFLERELLVFMKENYRVSGESLAFGWQYAAAFLIQTMVEAPGLFNIHIVASPFPLTSQMFSRGKSRISLVDENIVNSDSFLYITVGKDEKMVLEGTDELSKVLEKKASQKLKWDYYISRKEEHRSTAYSALYHGISFYYHNYPELQFNTLKEFKDAGGLAYVYINTQCYQGR